MLLRIDALLHGESVCMFGGNKYRKDKDIEYTYIDKELRGDE